MLSIFNLPSLPNNPGCYLFKDSKGIIIYIGKAKNLAKRVKSYFQKPMTNHDSKTQNLIQQIDSVEFVVTNSEVEALILENNLIKKNSPKYNIDLKDSKRYSYALITNEKFPRLVLARNRIEKGEYFGPFIRAQSRDYVIELLNRTFKLRTCKKFPKKPCLRYHIGICHAPCVNLISEKDYNKIVKTVESVLKGKNYKIIDSLKLQMKNESDKLNFENALVLRNQIEAIEYLEERQNMERHRHYNEHIINYIIKENKVYLILFKISKGILDEKNEFEFNFSEDFFEEFLLQYYSENEIPKEIILPKDIDESLNIFLNEKNGKKVLITIPEKGEKKELLDLVLKNIEINFFGEEEKLEELKKAINLEETPRVIECFDISHLSGTAIVGSMIQFRNGKPDKNNYRRFKIKTVEQNDDFASINEIVFRRYYRLKMEKSELPNLIVIDGGKGQLSSAIEALNKLEIKIPIISIAKEFEEIYIPNESNPIILDKKNKGLQLVQAIRDEAHRFAISYNRLLRKKKMFEKED